MPISDATETIHRGDYLKVQHHAMAIFVELQKKSVSLFNAIKDWYRAKKIAPGDRKVPEIAIFEGSTVQRCRTEDYKNTVGNLYAKHLIEIFRVLAPDFGKDVWDLVKGLDTLKTVDGKQRLMPLLNKDELCVVADVLKLFSSHKHSVKVKTIVPRTRMRHRYVVKMGSQELQLKKETVELLARKKKLHVDQSVEALADSLGEVSI